MDCFSMINSFENISYAVKLIPFCLLDFNSQMNRSFYNDMCKYVYIGLSKQILCICQCKICQMQKHSNEYLIVLYPYTLYFE